MQPKQGYVPPPTITEPKKISLVECIVKGITLEQQMNAPVNLVDIISEVTGVHPANILGRSRYQPIIFARHMYVYFMSQYYDNGCELERMGIADHCTTINSCKAIRNMVEQNYKCVPQWMREVESIINSRPVDYGLYIR